MRRSKRYAGGLFGLAFLGAVATTASAEMGDEFESFDGEWQYRASCAGCHALDGSGFYAFGPALKDNPFVRNAPAPVLIEVIQKGRNYENRSHLAYIGMPAFPFLRGGTVESLVHYMKTGLQRAVDLAEEGSADLAEE